jgi:hypothetical protein
LKNQQLAPICLFTYNRISETIKTIEALQNNFLAKQSHLYIYSDGGKDDEDFEKISKVRDYLHSVSGFKSINIFESLNNKGLANSVIAGVSKVLENHDKIIVLEDDLVSSPNFLNFLNQSLEFYEKDNNIFSISGYTLNLPSLPGKKDYYFGYRASSWGWGIWSDRWNEIDWNVSDYDNFKNNKEAIKKFKRGGSDLPRMLKNQITGKIDSWAIRFCYHQSKNNIFTVFPTKSKLISIGFSEAATNTIGTKRFNTPLDEELKIEFEFQNFENIDKNIINEFASKFSIKSRIQNQLNKFFKKFNQ